MGGLNQTRYGAKASAYPSNSTQGMGFATLPEYQHPAAKQNLRPAPRQHIVPASSLHGSGDSLPSRIESPTNSTSGSSNTSSNPCFHYNPYDTTSSRVNYQQQQQPQQHYAGDGGYYPHPQAAAPQHQQQQQQAHFPPHQEANTAGSWPAEEEEAEYHQHHQVDAMGMGGGDAPCSTLPFGTLHGHGLEGRVSFIPYPTEEFVNPNKEVHHVPSEGHMSRVFLGQLPYQVTDMQLDWLCFTFGNGGAVHFPERITKHDPMRGCKVPTGCIHAYADNDNVTQMLNQMHKRILVDDTGVWFAGDANEQSTLNDYCMMMKNDRTKRYQNRPYDTVVAQFATSSFVRRR